MPKQDTPDLIATMERIAKEAKRARQGISRGSVPNGVGSLRKIEEESSDALFRAGRELR